MKGERSVGTYYWVYRLNTQRGDLGRLRYSRNFKTREQAYNFKRKIGNKWYSGNLYFSASSIYDEYIE